MNAWSGKSQSTLARWGTYAMRARARSTGWPNTLTSPESRGVTPRAAFSRVDLPAPFGPTMADIARAGKVASTENTAGFCA
jgi:hypothetical protein